MSGQGLMAGAALRDGRRCQLGVTRAGLELEPARSARMNRHWSLVALAAARDGRRCRLGVTRAGLGLEPAWSVGMNRHWSLVPGDVLSSGAGRGSGDVDVAEKTR